MGRKKGVINSTPKSVHKLRPPTVCHKIKATRCHVALPFATLSFALYCCIALPYHPSIHQPSTTSDPQQESSNQLAVAPSHPNLDATVQRFKEGNFKEGDLFTTHEAGFLDVLDAKEHCEKLYETAKIFASSKRK